MGARRRSAPARFRFAGQGSAGSADMICAISAILPSRSPIRCVAAKPHNRNVSSRAGFAHGQPLCVFFNALTHYYIDPESARPLPVSGEFNAADCLLPSAFAPLWGRREFRNDPSPRNRGCGLARGSCRGRTLCSHRNRIRSGGAGGCMSEKGEPARIPGSRQRASIPFAAAFGGFRSQSNLETTA